MLGMQACFELLHCTTYCKLLGGELIKVTLDKRHVAADSSQVLEHGLLCRVGGSDQQPMHAAQSPSSTHLAAQVPGTQDRVDLPRFEKLLELLRQIWDSVWNVQVRNAQDQHPWGMQL
jgi:hypothetical protein